VLGEVGFAVQLLFIPQLINFLYSCPQLFKFYPCPRHRLTLYNIKNDTLTGVRDHMNLLNLSLRIIGPTNEGVLCEKLLLFQIITSAVGIAIGACF
jgi:UDP-N-acetylglucosamine--dolichyl-phosphate N-acetylglucosaminephosphotransferase